MTNIIKLGDKSDHGGVMIQATGAFTVDDVAGCVTGDLHQCPIRGHGTTPVTGSSIDTANGRSIIKTGDKAGCGASLIGSGSATVA